MTVILSILKFRKKEIVLERMDIKKRLHSSNKRNSLLLKKGPPPGIWP